MFCNIVDSVNHKINVKLFPNKSYHSFPYNILAKSFHRNNKSLIKCSIYFLVILSSQSKQLPSLWQTCRHYLAVHTAFVILNTNIIWCIRLPENGKYYHRIKFLQNISHTYLNKISKNILMNIKFQNIAEFICVIRHTKPQIKVFILKRYKIFICGQKTNGLLEQRNTRILLLTNCHHSF